MARTAVVAGVGPGLGASVARKLAGEGCRVGLFARSSGFVSDLAADLADSDGDALAVPTDVGDREQVRAGFERVREAYGPVDVLVHNASAADWSGLREQSPEAFERAWRVGAYGGFCCAREAVSDMLAGDGGGGDGGTVIFTGATSSVRGRGGAVGFSAAKFAVRGLAESMARELGPAGVHVAHVVIDGQIRPPGIEGGDDGRLDPDEIAESYWHLIEQDESAWTLELDLRPGVEEF